MCSQGLAISYLFMATAASLQIFRLDWLHVADLGISADWIGQLSKVLVAKPWLRVQELHVLHRGDPNLTTSRSTCSLVQSLQRNFDIWSRVLRSRTDLPRLAEAGPHKPTGAHRVARDGRVGVVLRVFV